MYAARNFGLKAVTVISDCIIGYDKKKFPEMLDYYKNKG